MKSLTLKSSQLKPYALIKHLDAKTRVDSTSISVNCFQWLCLQSPDCEFPWKACILLSHSAQEQPGSKFKSYSTPCWESNIVPALLPKYMPLKRLG